MRVIHPFEPVCGAGAKIIILGTIPSPASRRQGFYYGHPRNRFWRVLAGLFGSEIPGSVGQKTDLLVRNGIALWDAAAKCEISGAEDYSIRAPELNDVAGFMESRGIARAFANGQTAGRLLRKGGVDAVILPSTSPANAKMGLDELKEKWSAILEFLG